MNIVMEPAYFISNPIPDIKNRLKLIGATWSSTANGYFLTQEQKLRLDNNDIPEPTLPSGIFVENQVIEWSIHGNTFNKKESLKNLGAKWDPMNKSWKIPLMKVTYDDIIAALS